MIKLFKKASEDEKIKAIVLRVDSPGGDYVASDIIWKEIQQTVARGKPVIVSMGDVTASGGYFISTHASKIVAQPATVTGSIGIFFGKFNLSEFLGQYGIDYDTISLGENATIGSGVSDWTKKQQEYVKLFVDYAYQDFINRVAEGRKLSPEFVREKCAKGRVYLGQEAKELGLVDELGGLKEALLLACKEANLDPKEAERYVVVSRDKPLFAQIVREIRGGQVSLWDVQYPNALQNVIEPLKTAVEASENQTTPVSLLAPTELTKLSHPLQD
eukprot:TRINITY_DN2527_c0_g1_i1.p1 TRINITY_DN2527_c0_g1~~TRINITY_DN2527_c0_g1_i1.p1  ORF type:complete len:273 (-),score=72.43 TRINITY_DN2527_c0_g1_i1:126-944(-)